MQGFQPMSIRLGGHGLQQHRHETDHVTNKIKYLYEISTSGKICQLNEEPKI